MSLPLRALLSSSVLVVACGGEDPKAQDKCETLVTSYCDRVVSCAKSAGLLGGSYTADDLHDDCEQSVAADAHCDDAVKVSPSYGQCITDAKTLSCDDVDDALASSTEVPLPDSCLGAVLYPE